MGNKSIDYCGTPALNALFDAQDAYHAGKPIPTGIEVEELTINVHEEKIGSIHMETTKGKIIKFDIPKMTVEGTGEEIITVDDGFLEQLSALPPHLARLKVRRFAFRENHYNSIFEILRFALWTYVVSKEPEEIEEAEEADQEIIDKVCRKAIKKFKEQVKPSYIGDYSDDFNSYDALAFGYCCLGYALDELNPHLEDYIFKIIEDCSEGTNIFNLNPVFTRFIEMLDEHSNLRKIQKVYEKY